MSDDKRIDALEAKLAFQEDTIAALNNALVGQQSRIDRLEKTLQLAVREIEDLRGDPDPARDEPPPHY